MGSSSAGFLLVGGAAARPALYIREVSLSVSPSALCPIARGTFSYSARLADIRCFDTLNVEDDMELVRDDIS